MRAICSKQSTLKSIELKCGKCGKSFTTKNIDYVGARTIFPVDGDCEHGIEDLKVITPKNVDMKSFQEELSLFKSQGRTAWDVDRLFELSYGKTVKELGLVYESQEKEPPREGIAIIK